MEFTEEDLQRLVTLVREERNAQAEALREGLTDDEYDPGATGYVKELDAIESKLIEAIMEVGK